MQRMHYWRSTMVGVPITEGRGADPIFIPSALKGTTRNLQESKYPFCFCFDPLCLSPRSSLSTIVHKPLFVAWSVCHSTQYARPGSTQPSPYRPTTPSNSRTLCVVVLRASVKLTWHLPSLARDHVLSPPPNKRPAEGVSWGYWGP